MAKVKFTLSLDADTAERIRCYAREHHMTASAAVTAWAWELVLQDEKTLAHDASNTTEDVCGGVV